MSESRKLIKKAVLAGVGASNSVERIKNALNDAMQDLVKVGNDLFDELEDKGKEKTENVQNFLKNLQDEATKRTLDAEKKVSSKVSTSTKKAAKELGLITKEEFEDILDRLTALEEHAFGSSTEGSADGGESKKRARSKKNQSTNDHE
jgi:polyhydroxyalkanoate synthesis regulator phasin